MRATHLLELFELEFAEFDLLVCIICTVIHKDRFDAFHLNRFFMDFWAVIICVFRLYTGDIVAVQVRQFQKDRDEQARCEFECVHSSFVLSTADIMSMPVCKFQKDRDEQAKGEFESVLPSFVLYTADIVSMLVCQFK